MSVFYSKLNLGYALTMGFGIFILNLAAHLAGFFERYAYPYILILESILIIGLARYFVARWSPLGSYKKDFKSLFFTALLAGCLAAICTYVYLAIDGSMHEALFSNFMELLNGLKLDDELLGLILNYGFKLMQPLYFSLIFKGFIPFLLIFILSNIIWILLASNPKK